jgi:PIN like domain
MKRTFVGYYRPTEDEFAKLWAEARIVLDANVLLAVYGVSPSTRAALLRLLDSVRQRLWIPHQYALEYQRNRIGKILEQVRHYENAHRSLSATLQDQFRSATRHPFVPADVEIGLERVCQSLVAGRAEQEELLVSDPHFDRTTELFDGRVGPPYSDADLSKAYEVGRKRLSEKIPPGYKDSNKPEPDRYGDYVGWRQILDFAVKNNVSVMLITDDDKEDWWRKDGGKAYGPRPELVAEFRSCCSGLFYMYASHRFLELSEKYLGGAVDPKAISELKERQESESLAVALKPAGSTASTPPAVKPATYPQNSDLDEEKLVPKTRKLKKRLAPKPEEK